MRDLHNQIIAPCALALLVTMACNSAYANAQTYLTRARQYQQAKRYATALEFYNQAIAEDPKLVEAYYGRAESFVAAGWESKALPDCNKVIALAPKKYPNIYRFKALADRQSEKPADVITDCNKAIELGIKDERILYLRGGAYRELGDYKKALTDFNKIMEMMNASHLQPVPKIDLLDSRGELFEALGQPDKALADWATGMKLEPQHEMAYTQTARLYDRLGQTAKSVDIYSVFLKRFPEDSQAWAERGRFNLKLKRYQDAVTDLSHAITLEPVSYPKLYQARAEAYAKQGKSDLAAKDRKTFDDMQR